MTAAIVIRATHATANALTITANFAYVGLQFPESMAKVFVSIVLSKENEEEVEEGTERKGGGT